jgi:3',5'-cyclic AMP phosphodiesterase CpdA
VIRIAAVGDIHFGADLAGTLRPHLEQLRAEADVLLLAGDLTKVGRPEEAAVHPPGRRRPDTPLKLRSSPSSATTTTTRSARQRSSGCSRPPGSECWKARPR